MSPPVVHLCPARTCVLIFMNTDVSLVIIKLHSWLWSLIIFDYISMLSDAQHGRRRRGTGSCRREREREKNNSSTLNSGGFYFHQVLPGLEIKPYQGGWLGTVESCWWAEWAGTWTGLFPVLTQEWGNGFGSIRPVMEAQQESDGMNYSNRSKGCKIHLAVFHWLQGKKYWKIPGTVWSNKKTQFR